MPPEPAVEGVAAAPLWVFGYASLIWRPDFHYVEDSVAWLDGYQRVLWQGSPDHRGVPGAPGRVATLVRQADARCGGRAFRLAAGRRDQVMAALDQREQGGYDRVAVDIELRDGRRVAALTYIGGADNPWYLGPADEATIAQQIAASRGPSGANADYVIELARALEALRIPDPAITRLAALLGAN